MNSRRLRILIIADPKIPVPPVHYGGAERIIALLADGLQKLGHRVDLLAGPDSKSFGGKLHFHQLPSNQPSSRAFRKIWFQYLSSKMALGVDVVINFGRLDYLEAISRMSVPLICVFQNPVVQSEVDWIQSRRTKKLKLIGVSHSQIDGLSPSDALSVIHNACDLKSYDFQETPSSPPYLAFLGRITSNKGADMAIKVALSAGLPLKLAGNISDEPGDREFFEQVISPQLGSGIEYMGPVNDGEKNQLLGGASALLFPIRWKEPFGITMLEALACGTPVIATRCASTPEVIQHGETGFLCDSENAMVKAIESLPSLDRSACRKAAVEKYSQEALVKQYQDVIYGLF